MFGTKENTKDITPKNRMTTSIYVDRDIHKEFVKKCKRLGSSSCNVLEAFEYAFIKGVSKFTGSPLPVVNVNLTVNRVVQRLHRVDHEWSGATRKRIRVVRADGSFYFVWAFPDTSMEYDDLKEV